MSSKKTAAVLVACLSLGGLAVAPSVGATATTAQAAGRSSVPAAINAAATATTTTTPTKAAATATPSPTKAAATTTLSPTKAATTTATPKATASATATPAPAMVVVTPTVTNRGSVIAITGTGFLPKEIVNLTLDGSAGATTAITADAMGAFPSVNLAVPYSLAPGDYTLVATGATSKRKAQTAVTVAKLGPTITLSTPSLKPNAVETVMGKGFGSREQIALSLNGEALTTSPAVITTTNGVFTATFTAPGTLLRGLNTLSALGTQSRVAADAPITGVLTRSVQFYFAGAINTQSDRSIVNLLNTNSVPASVRLTFYFENGATYTRLVRVPAESERAERVANLGNLPAGRYGLAISADRTIGAQITTNRDPLDGDVLTGATALGTHWYLADGSTIGTSQERVSILNPSQTATTVQLQFVSLGRARKTAYVGVAAHSNRVINVNSYYPNAQVSVIAISSRPVLVERTLSFAPHSRAYTSRTAARTPSSQWLFTDATTENGVVSILSILNPGDFGASVTASFSASNGRILRTVPLFVPARSRGTFTLNGTVSGGGIAVVVTSSHATVVELSEYIGGPGAAKAAAVELGRNGVGTQWTYAGGDTTSGHDDVLVVYNPSALTVPITGTFYSTSGQVVTRTYSVGPTDRIVIAVNTLGLTAANGAVLTSGNGQGFIAVQGVSSRDSHLLSETQGSAQ